MIRLGNPNSLELAISEVLEEENSPYTKGNVFHKVLQTKVDMCRKLQKPPFQNHPNCSLKQIIKLTNTSKIINHRIISDLFPLDNFIHSQ